MRILVTGANGMVGRNISECAKDNGFELLTPPSSKLNLLSRELIVKYILENDVECVIHSAGVVGGIQANIAHPVKFFHDNMLMGLNIVMASKEANVKKLLNLGSSCMYPRNATNPLREESVLKGELEPTNEGYAIAKAGVSRLCDYIVKESSEYSYRTLIPCNLYGRYDKFGEHNSHMIPAVISKIHEAKLSGKKEVEIWGDGTARREFMYAGDLATIVLESVENIKQLPQVLNIGLGFDYTINEYYEAVAEVVGFNGNFVHDLTKPVGMQQKLVSTDRMNQLGWKANTSLEEGIRKTYEYYLEQA